MLFYESYNLLDVEQEISMGSLFSVDGHLYKFINRLVDMFKLNMMWLLCSLPIVTMGAATTAAYTITLKMVEEEEGYIAGPFWKEFKANIKKGSITGVIFLVALYAIYLDFQLFQVAEKYNTMFLIIGVIAVYLLFMHTVYAFPLLARYENSVINTMQNSYSIAAKFLGKTFFLALLLLVELAIIFWNFTTMFVGLLFGPACIFLTISGFASSFFKVIEQENDMAEEVVEEEDESDDDEFDEESAEEGSEEDDYEGVSEEE